MPASRRHTKALLSWLNTVWLRDNFKEQFIEKIRQTSAVLNEGGVAIAPEKAWLPVAETADGIKSLWDLLNGWQAGHEILPRRNEAVGWWNTLNSWANVSECQTSSFNESIDGQKLASNIDDKTHNPENHGKIEDLQNLLRENVSAAIGVTQFDLLREFVAKTDKERDEQNEIFTKILVATRGDLSQISEFVQDLEEDENLFSHLAERRESRRIVHENQSLGQQVERLVKELLEDKGFAVCRTGTGSDYEISIDKGCQSWLIEVKATRDQVVRMSDIQAKTAVEQGNRFLLCVVPVDVQIAFVLRPFVLQTLKSAELLGGGWK